MKIIEGLCKAFYALLALILVRKLLLWLITQAGYDGLTPSDWAAWVQAIGSVGAIFASVYLVNLQDRKEREREREQVLRKEAKLATNALILAKEFSTLLKCIVSDIGTEITVPTSNVIRARAQVTILLARFEGIPTWEMGIGEAALLGAIATLGRNVVVLLEAFDKDRPHQANNYKHVMPEFARAADGITEQLQGQYECLKQYLPFDARNA